MSEEKKGFWGRLVSGLSKTRDNIVSGIDGLFHGFSHIDDDFYEELEEILIMGDIGVRATMDIIDDLKEKVKINHIKEPIDCKQFLIDSIKEQMNVGEAAYEFEHQTSVVLVIGVNGVGKTTTIGKLAGKLRAQGKKVVLAAADTFRAAAGEQLKEWAHRAEADLIGGQEGSDPAAVVYDAVAAAVDGDTITLLSNVERVEPLVVDKNLTIDGAGKTITSSAVRAIVIDGAKNVILKNFNLVAGGERGIQLQNNAQNVTIENVTAVSANYTVNLTTSTGAANVTINNCDLKGLNTVNVWGEGANVVINNTTLRTEDNADEGYATIYNAGKNAIVTVNGGAVVFTGSKINSYAGVLLAEGAEVTYNGTEGDNLVVYGHAYIIRYGEYQYSFATWAAAYDTAKEGETIVLTQDVTIAEGLQVTKSVNFDLNGHTLAYTGNDVVFRVKNGATVTIDGSKANSAIVTNPTNHGGASAGNGYIGLVSEDATLNINGGSYDAQRTCTIAQVVKGTLNVNAGTFKVDLSEYTDANGNASYLLNCTDANYKNGTAVVNVNGGSFYKFNPANNAAEGANTNFAEGKTVTEAEGWYTVE